MPNCYIATKTNISEQPWWIPYENIQTNVLACLQSEKENQKRPKGKSEKAKMKKDEKEDEEEDEEEEGKIKDKKRICINPLKISPPLNFAPRLSKRRGGI